MAYGALNIHHLASGTIQSFPLPSNAQSTQHVKQRLILNFVLVFYIQGFSICICVCMYIREIIIFKTLLGLCTAWDQLGFYHLIQHHVQMI